MATKELAIDIAFDAHDGQVRRDGEPYVIHPLEVMFMMEEDGFTEDYQIAAVLHDVVEDSEGRWTIDRLRKCGFSERILRIVDILTKKPDQTDDEYEEKILGCYEASQVKARDMRHNLNSNPKKNKIPVYLARTVKIKERYGLDYNPDLEVAA
jgi:(p)ppGpp synthase/HD superfamily hydrolase